MSYTPTTWVTGDTITAVKLNNMEQGIANAGGMVAPTFTEIGEQQFTCDKTFAEVNTAIKAGKCCYAFLDTQVLILTEYYEDDTAIFSCFIVGGGVFKTNIAYDTTGITFSEDVYPD